MYVILICINMYSFRIEGTADRKELFGDPLRQLFRSIVRFMSQPHIERCFLCQGAALKHLPHAMQYITNGNVFDAVEAS